ncbi:MAG TPA: lipopolysaccharide assembly protein LapA domain-containing protein [Gaiella sp.]|jgi:uncharacterized integral membrane protein
MADETPPASRPPEPGPAPAKGGIPWRMIGFGVLAAYGILLAVLNSDEVHVEFLFWDTRASLVILLLLTLAIGFLAGFLFDTARDRRKRQAQ